MKYIQIILHKGRDTSQTYNVEEGKVTVLKNVKGVNYELHNKITGAAPQNIIAKRDGQDLVIILDENEGDGSHLEVTPDIIIKDYYGDIEQEKSALENKEEVTEVTGILIGQHENGKYYAYIPESGDSNDAVSILGEDEAKPQAIGGEEIDCAVISPWWGLFGLLPLAFIPLAFIKSNASVGPAETTETGDLDFEISLDRPTLKEQPLKITLKDEDGKLIDDAYLNGKTIEVSFDGGNTYEPVTVSQGVINVVSPAGNRTIHVKLPTEPKMHLGSDDPEVSISVQTASQSEPAENIGVIRDTEPKAHPDTNSVTEDMDTDPATPGIQTITKGNVLGGTHAGTSAGDQADTLNVDGPATNGWVTGVTLGSDTSAPVTGNLATAINGEYGKLTLNADGSYTYALYTEADVQSDASLKPKYDAVQALNKEDPALKDVFSYTITDKDGDSSTTTLTIDVKGVTDPNVIVPDVYDESKDPTDPKLPKDPAKPVTEIKGDQDNVVVEKESVTGIFKLQAPNELKNVVIGEGDKAVTITKAQLEALETAPQIITTEHGTLTLTKADPTNGAGDNYTVTYNYVSTKNEDHSNNKYAEKDSIKIVLNEENTKQTAEGTLDIAILDTEPVAKPDTNSVVEDGDKDSNSLAVTGDLLKGTKTDATGTASTDESAKDTLNVDVPTHWVTNVQKGEITPADGKTAATMPAGTEVTDAPANTATGVAAGETMVQGTYGTLYIKQDGTYRYVLDNDSDAVQSLTPTSNAKDVFSYTITDKDGDLSSTTLTIDVTGKADSAIDLPEKTHSVIEGSNATSTVQTLKITDNPRFLKTLKIGNGTEADTQEIDVSETNTKSVTISKDGVTITITGYDKSTGTLKYTYAEDDKPNTHTDASKKGADDVLETLFSLTGTDKSGTTVTAGSITVKIEDTAPVAVADKNTVSEDATTPVTGNVLGGIHTGASTGDQADTLNVDGPATTGWVSKVENTSIKTPTTPVEDKVVTKDAPAVIKGKYGELTLNADGSYSYKVDDSDEVQALKQGESLKDVFTYTISDSDGDTSETTLTIDVTGANEDPTTFTVTGGQTASEGLINDAEKTGTYLEYNIALDGRADEDVPVTLSIDSSSQATSGKDFEEQLQFFNPESQKWENVPANNQLDLPKNQDVVKVRVKVIHDKIAENPETVILKATTTSDEIVNTPAEREKMATDTILDDNDPVPTLPKGSNTIVEVAKEADGTTAHKVIGKMTVENPQSLDTLKITNKNGTPIEITGAKAGSEVTIESVKGTLKVTAYNKDTGEISYEYTSTDPQNHSGTTPVVDDFVISGTDTKGQALVAKQGDANSGHLKITITDTVPVARPDTNSVTEDTDTDTATAGIQAIAKGNVLGGTHTGTSTGDQADTLNVDGSATTGWVTGVALGSNTSASVTGKVATAIKGKYGTLTLNADGSYDYVLDNDSEVVQSLTGSEAQQPKDVFTYTIEDSDGDKSTTTLTINVNGVVDVPIKVPSAEHSVVEADNTANDEQTLTFTDNPSNLKSLSIGGTEIDLATLNSAADKPTVVKDGVTLTINSYNPTTGELKYTYVEDNKPNDHSTNDPIVVDFGITGKDKTGASIEFVDSTGAKATKASIVVKVIDTVPEAKDDADSMSKEDTAPAKGNVISGVGTTDEAAGKDVLNVDTDVKLNKVKSNLGTDTAEKDVANNDTTETTVDGKYGTLKIKSDGSYTYELHKENQEVKDLPSNKQLHDTFDYTITDKDGDPSTATLDIEIKGELPPTEVNIKRTGAESIAENGTTPLVFEVSQNALTLDVDEISSTTVPNAQDTTVTAKIEPIGNKKVTADDIASIKVTGADGNEIATLTDKTEIQKFFDVGYEVTIPAKSIGKPTFEILPKNNEVFEGKENLTMTISDSSNLKSTIDVGSASGNITDDADKPTVTISANEVEEGNPATVTVTLDKASEEAVVVKIKTVAGGTAEQGADKDYVDQEQTVTIPAGQKSITTTINTIDDPKVESKTIPETVKIEGEVTSGTVANTEAPKAEIKITDNDKPTVSISGTTVEEGKKSVVTVSLDKESNEPITIEVTTSNGTAENGDYTSVTKEVTIDAGKTSATLEVQTTNDTDIEAGDPETITLTATVKGNNANLVTNTTATGTSKIVDNDATIDITSINTKDQPAVGSDGGEVVDTANDTTQNTYGEISNTVAAFPVSGTTTGVGDGATVNITLTDTDGHTATGTATVIAGKWVSPDIDVSTLTLTDKQDLKVTATVTENVMQDGVTVTKTAMDVDKSPITAEPPLPTNVTLWDEALAGAIPENGESPVAIAQGMIKNISSVTTVDFSQAGGRSEGDDIQWSYDSSTHTAKGTANGEDVMRIVFDGAKYTAEILKPIEHNRGNGENTKDFIFTTGGQSFTVTVNDDSPGVRDGAKYVGGGPKPLPEYTNLDLVLDFSQSMSTFLEDNVHNRADAMQSAVISLLNEYKAQGKNVKVSLTAFGTDAVNMTDGYVSVDKAISILQQKYQVATGQFSVNNHDLGIKTNYDAALAVMQKTFNDHKTSRFSGPSVSNKLIFVSDGEPNRTDGDDSKFLNTDAGSSPDGIFGDEKTNWHEFLNAHKITADALGIYSSTGEKPNLDKLRDVANGTTKLVDVSDLGKQLKGELNPDMLTIHKTATDSNEPAWGADGLGYLKEITLDKVILRNGATKSNVKVVFEPGGFRGDTLKMYLDSYNYPNYPDVEKNGVSSYKFQIRPGVEINIDFKTGEYTISGNLSEDANIKYTIIDRDGDEGSATTTLTSNVAHPDLVKSIDDINPNEHTLPILEDGELHTIDLDDAVTVDDHVLTTNNDSGKLILDFSWAKLQDKVKDGIDMIDLTQKEGEESTEQVVVLDKAAVDTLTQSDILAEGKELLIKADEKDTIQLKGGELVQKEVVVDDVTYTGYDLDHDLMADVFVYGGEVLL